jgi:hypothetical protein
MSQIQLMVSTYMTKNGTINQPVGIATFPTDLGAGSLRLLLLSIINK